MDNVELENTSNEQVQHETAAQAAERMFKQSELNEIVGRAKHEAVESFKRQQAQQKPQSQPTQHYDSRLTEDDIKRLTAEEINRQREEFTRESRAKAETEAAQRIVSAYHEKIAPARDKYEDFESVTSTLNMAAYPNVVQLLAEHVDNAGDVLYNLARNRSKLAQLEFTCSHNAPDGIYEIKRLSSSIKENDQYSNVRQPKAPLSQQRPSSTGMDSKSTLSMTDLKRKYRG